MRCLCAHVLPGVPVRQWVLTAPHEARRVLALRPDALTAQGRIFVEGIARWQKRVASAGGETGAVTFVQRFNSTLGCFVHVHVIVPDGVFRADDAGAVVFREGPAPTRADIADVAARVEKRMRRWLRRRALLDERAAEDRSNDAPERSPLEACMQLSFFLSSEAPICGSREMARQRRERERERGSSLPRSRQGPVGGGSVGVQRACGRHRARGSSGVSFYGGSICWTFWPALAVGGGRLWLTSRPARCGRGHPGAPRAASVCATDRAGAESRLRFYMSGNGSARGRRRGRRREREGVPRGRRARGSGASP